jgi:DNA-binding MarR family transcriptional regulator
MLAPTAINRASELAQCHLGYALKQLHHLLRAAMEHRLRKRRIGLTFPHAAALFLLSESPGLSGAQLARWAMVTPQTMNQILTRLEAEGCIVREADPEHGRILRARVTARGKKAFELGCEVADQLMEEMQAGLRTSQRSELLHLLARCQINMLDLARAEKMPLQESLPTRKPVRKPARKSPRRADAPGRTALPKAATSKRSLQTRPASSYSTPLAKIVSGRTAKTSRMR